MAQLLFPQQIIDIPANRHVRLDFDVPSEIPTGTANVELSISPELKPPKMSRQMKKLMKYYGCLKDSPTFAGDSVELVRKMRDEWDRPWESLAKLPD
ncbi:MAG: hypothetical protein LBT39_00740 [Treponema sp.]|jgi:hypothetical protein|nr:hypothetical protein [Treponema sp.]